MGPLRLLETVLLYIGADSGAEFADRLAREFGSEIANQVLRHLPVADELAVRALSVSASHRIAAWKSALIHQRRSLPCTMFTPMRSARSSNSP